ncbi:uncharacterized protein TNCV_3542361 [Trichonephila clavipes]|uniref:Uncharacterized protein n=1 Tax=Trichonephila clavipes TaxID=2585209 RepID=A0A8X6V1B6_TRICX|nr:uncharacterized protein TNCV_3542361 [Trichonephila clavipes]
MIHGPCGTLNPSSSCMKEEKYTKKYPRALLKDIQTNDKGYPLNRRRAPEDVGRIIAQKARESADEYRLTVSDIPNASTMPFSRRGNMSPFLVG